MIVAPASASSAIFLRPAMPSVDGRRHVKNSILHSTRKDDVTILEASSAVRLSLLIGHSHTYHLIPAWHP